MSALPFSQVLYGVVHVNHTHEHINTEALPTLLCMPTVMHGQPMSAQDTLMYECTRHTQQSTWHSGRMDVDFKDFLMRGRVKEKVILKLQEKDISFEDFQSLREEELQLVFARGVSVGQFLGWKGNAATAPTISTIKIKSTAVSYRQYR